MLPHAVTAIAPRWAALPSLRAWLWQQADALFSFFEKDCVDPRGGLHDLDAVGKPTTLRGDKPARQIHGTARMIHAFAIAYQLGRPGADAIIDHGMDFLWNGHRDSVNGGYFWAAGYERPTADTKQAYGHAFVLLAACSAKVVGHPDADRLLTDIITVIVERFWEEDHGAAAEQFTRDWQNHEGYRGQNSNMHLTEAFMAAFEATGGGSFLRMAERVADLIIRRHADENGWRLPEHFTADWQVDRNYSGDPVFRPYGSTPGHWLEWARLLLQLWELGQRKLAWLPTAARKLFRQAVTEGWNHDQGGFFYTLDWGGSPRNRYWWPCCEGIGAAAFLGAIDGDAFYEEWYRRVWNFSAAHFIDKRLGGWHPSSMIT